MGDSRQKIKPANFKTIAVVFRAKISQNYRFSKIHILLIFYQFIYYNKFLRCPKQEECDNIYFGP